MKVCIINIYYGPWPEWMPYFLSGCLINRNINWIFFSANEPPPHSGKNLIFHRMKKEEFNQLATKKVGFRIHIDDPYKLCDLKPAFGKIFEDYLAGYDFWGYGDIDMILGDIREFLPEGILKDFDIISTYRGFLSGPFCLFRNNERMNGFFKKHTRYRKIFQNRNHTGFDENIPRNSLEGFSLRKLKYFICFSLSSIRRIPDPYYSLTEHRYQFQWHFKKKSVAFSEIMDMTDLVHLEAGNRNVRVLFTDLLFTDLFFRRIGRKDWKLEWNNGILTDLRHDRKIFGFHYMDEKKEGSFRIENTDGPVHRFFISNKGLTIG